ncbi:MAG: ComEC/Rec2 family competence protein [Planctomycetes bacterium]|nr:ComEC/Rec2 family competence protein [Planctomycetota bacterium]
MLRSYPLLPAAIAWYAGLRIAFALGLVFPGSTPWITASASIVIMILVRALPEKLRPRTGYLLLITILAMLAAYRAGGRSGQASTSLSATGEGLHYFRGKVLDVDSPEGPGRYRGTLKITGYRTDGEWREADVPVRLGSGHVSLVPGDLLEGHFRTWRIAEDGYYRKTLLAAGIGNSATAGPDVRRTGHRAGIRRWIFLWRSYAARRLAGRAYGDVVACLVIGDPGLMPGDTLEAGRASGALHLFVVSGLHLGIFGGLVMLVCGRLGISIGRRNLLAVGVTFIYLAMTGFGAPALRAWIMFSLLVLGPLVQRAYDPVNALSAAVLGILIIWPEEAVGYGLHLAIAAITGILAATYLFGETVRKLEHRLLRRVAEAGTASLCASIGVMPFLGAFFGRAPLAAPLGALLGVPLITILIATGSAVTAGTTLAHAAGAISGSTALERAIEFAVGTSGPLYWFTAGVAGMLSGTVGALGGLPVLNMAVHGPPGWFLPLWLLWMGGLTVAKLEHDTRRLLFSERVTGVFRKSRIFRYGFLPAGLILLLAWPVIGECCDGMRPGTYVLELSDGTDVAIRASGHDVTAYAEKPSAETLRELEIAFPHSNLEPLRPMDELPSPLRGLHVLSETRIPLVLASETGSSLDRLVQSSPPGAIMVATGRLPYGAGLLREKGRTILAVPPGGVVIENAEEQIVVSRAGLRTAWDRGRRTRERVFVLNYRITNGADSDAMTGEQPATITRPAQGVR